MRMSGRGSRGHVAGLALLEIAPEDEEFLAEAGESFGVGAEAVGGRLVGEEGGERRDSVRWGLGLLFRVQS